MFVCMIFSIYTIFSLFDNIIKTIAELINSIHYRDAKQFIEPDETIKSISHIIDAFDNLKTNIQNLKLEKEKQSYYLKYIIEQIKAGIIIYDNNYKIEYLNDYACSILQIKTVKNLSELKDKKQDFFKLVKSLKADKSEYFKTTDTQKQYSVHFSKLIFKEKSLNFIIIHDIKSELEEQEVESWTKLIRILTHEIMNSLSPITSLSSTINAIVTNTDVFDKDTIDDLKTASHTISKRSNGLLSFVNSFRNMVKIPEPKPNLFSHKSLFLRIKKIYEEKANEINLNISFIYPENDIYLLSDENLLEQCMINLINNAIDAVSSLPNPIISVTFKNLTDYVEISINDNGIGIKKDNLDKIFIPFFTTKTSGSGIGLSMVKQILRKLKAEINIDSIEDKGTNVTIKLSSKSVRSNTE